jgi:ATP phosphoribosyltransferase
MIQIALPNKGALSDEALELVREAGYRCRRSRGELLVRDTENDIEFYFLRPRDIAVYVHDGILELGITGRDLTADSDVQLEELLPLGFGGARFCYAGPADGPRKVSDFEGKRIATSYPSIVERDLARRGIDAQVVRLDGAVEIAIALGVADVVADVVQTGTTLAQAGLTLIGEPVLASEAILVARDETMGRNGQVRTFIERLRGIILAREYVMIEYDIERRVLAEAEAITPGIESPTVAPLTKEGWVAVKSMTRRRNVNQIMDDLATLGARGIIVTDIRTCRI